MIDYNTRIHVIKLIIKPSYDIVFICSMINYTKSPSCIYTVLLAAFGTVVLAFLPDYQSAREAIMNLAREAMDMIVILHLICCLGE